MSRLYGILCDMYDIIMFSVVVVLSVGQMLMLGGFFFFKQKTAYEIQYGLVGSEMCIRDRYWIIQILSLRRLLEKFPVLFYCFQKGSGPCLQICLLYTSDAADERSSVDLGGRRIIKKKKTNKIRRRPPLYNNTMNMTHINNTYT